jgi:anaerobic selenocysteine-containing dehydrogenase
VATKIVKSTCQLDCPDACGLLVEVDEDSGRVVALRGNPEHPFTAGALCGKVSRSVDALYGPDRLTHPLARVGKKGENKFKPISWEEALDTIAERLRDSIDGYGAESILPLYFAGTMGHVQSWVFGPRFFAHLGASRLNTNICDGAAAAACSYLLGGSVGYDPEDIVHARLIVLWGVNTITTNMHHWKFIAEARARGAHLVAVDPVRTDTAAHCHQHFAPLPGTDAALALGLMRTILDEGAVDRAWLAAHTVGWSLLEERLAQWPVARAAEVCALEEDSIRSLGRRIAHTRPTAMRVGLGLQRTGGGGEAIRAIMALPALTGDWRHVGGGALSQTFSHFPYSWGEYVEPRGMKAAPARTVNMSRLGEALTELDDPPVMAAVVWNYNPVASNPNQNRVLKGFEREDLFVAAIEHRLTDTTDYADIVLPAASHFEQLDIVDSYGHNYLGWNAAAAPPYGDSLSNAEIFRRLAQRMGVDDPRVLRREAELIEELLDNDPCRERGITPERLRESGFIRAAGFEVGVAPFAAGGFPSASGKVELWSEAAQTDGLDPLVGYTPPTEVVDPELTQRFPFVLITPATRYFLNSTFASQPWHRGKAGPIIVVLNPEDASERKISDGARVRVYNDRGAFHAAAAVSDRVRPGVAMAPKQYWRRLTPGAATPNATTPERDADMAGAPTFHDNRVEIIAETSCAEH